MSELKRKVINFDLDTKALKENYKKGDWHNAYNDIKYFMEKNGFKHRQGSSYESINPMSKKQITSFVQKMATELSWLAKCLDNRNFDVTDIGNQYSVKNLILQTDKQNNLLKFEQDDNLSLLQVQRLQQFLMNYQEDKKAGYVFSNEQFIQFQTQMLRQMGDEEYISEEAKQRALRMSGEDLNLTAVMQLEPELSSDIDNSAVLAAFQPMLAKEQVQAVEEKVQIQETNQDNVKNDQEQVNAYNKEVQKQAQIKEQEQIAEQIKKDQKELEEQKSELKEKAWKIAKNVLMVATFVPPLATIGMPIKAAALATRAFGLGRAAKAATNAAELAPVAKAIPALEKEAIAYSNGRKGISIAKELGQDVVLEETQGLNNNLS